MRSEPRIGILPREEWTPQVEAIFPILVPPGAAVKGSDFNSLLVLAHHPELAEVFLRFNAAVGQGVALSARLRELAILRLSWRRNCLYEWVHHLHGGAAAGLTTEHFEGVMKEPVGDLFLPEEKAVLMATDDVCSEGALSDATWNELQKHFIPKQVIEILFAINCFLTVASLLNSAQVQLEPAFLNLAVAKGWPMLA